MSRFCAKAASLGPAIVTKSDDSLLIQAVAGTGDVERMPLEAKPLSDDEIATLRAWIDAGAPRPTSRCRPIRAIIGRSKNRCGPNCRR